MKPLSYLGSDHRLKSTDWAELRGRVGPGLGWNSDSLPSGSVTFHNDSQTTTCSFLDLGCFIFISKIRVLNPIADEAILARKNLRVVDSSCCSSSVYLGVWQGSLGLGVTLRFCCIVGGLDSTMIEFLMGMSNR